MVERILDLLWPRRCGVCERPVDRPGRHLCSDCLNRIPFIPTDGCCRVCGRAVEGQPHEYLCDDCKGANAPFFDRAASAVRFEAEARDLLLGYKFNRRLWYRDEFTDWLEGAARARFDVTAVDLVLPMPITLFHRLDRGYNQSAYLASLLAKRFDRPYAANVLVRTGHPKRQSELDEDARRENAKNTFAVRHPEKVRGRTVLVVDDIMTTGATLSECARELKSAGAWRIWCLTVARSIRT